MSNFQTLQELLMEVEFTNKVNINPNVALTQGSEQEITNKAKTDVGALSQRAKTFEEMDFRDKLKHLDKMYAAGKKLLAHVNSIKQTDTTSSDGAVESHFTPEEVKRIRSRVLHGFKQLKAMTVAVLRELEKEEQQISDQETLQ